MIGAGDKSFGQSGQRLRASEQKKIRSGALIEGTGQILPTLKSRVPHRIWIRKKWGHLLDRFVEGARPTEKHRLTKLGACYRDINQGKRITTVPRNNEAKGITNTGCSTKSRKRVLIACVIR